MENTYVFSRQDRPLPDRHFTILDPHDQRRWEVISKMLGIVLRRILKRQNCEIVGRVSNEIIHSWKGTHFLFYVCLQCLHNIFKYVNAALRNLLSLEIAASRSSHALNNLKVLRSKKSLLGKYFRDRLHSGTQTSGIKGW